MEALYDLKMVEGSTEVVQFILLVIFSLHFTFALVLLPTTWALDI